MKDVLILIIDTAHPTARVLLVDSEKVLGTKEWVNTPKVGTDLLVYIQEVLQEAGKQKEDIARVGVHTGPGSYGLVRTGIVTATILAQAVKAELVEVEGESPDALAKSARNAISGTPVTAKFRADTP